MQSQAWTSPVLDMCELHFSLFVFWFPTSRCECGVFKVCIYLIFIQRTTGHERDLFRSNEGLLLRLRSPKLDKTQTETRGCDSSNTDHRFSCAPEGLDVQSRADRGRIVSDSLWFWTSASFWSLFKLLSFSYLIVNWTCLGFRTVGWAKRNLWHHHQETDLSKYTY